MNIKESICPKCGAPSVGICNRCRVAGIEWYKCEPRIECVCCPTCFSVKRGANWSDISSTREELIDELAYSAVTFHPDVKDVSIVFDVRDISLNRTRLNYKISGTMYGVDIKGECSTLLVWKSESCDRCSRISGNYHEGIIQVRADRRGLTEYEKFIIDKIGHETEDRLQALGERFSFISRMTEMHDGIDIIIGSKRIGEEISHDIGQRFSATVTTHPKVVGEKAGIPIHRVTYLVRLPYHRTGDVVYANRMYLEIRDITRKYMKAVVPGTKQAYTLKEKDIRRLIGNVYDAEEAEVIYLSGRMAGIMDPKSYRTVEIPVADPDNPPSPGDRIRLLRDNVTEEIVPIW